MSSSSVPVRLVVLVATSAILLAGCGSSDDNNSADDAAVATTIAPFPTALPTPRSLTQGETERAAPRWEQVKVLTGNAPTEVPLTITQGAIQWRVKWNCETGKMVIRTNPPPPRSGPLVDSPCPDKGEGFSVLNGDITLAVDASGPWKATVEQQVDTPVDDPPLPEMASARVLGQGAFYNVEKTGGGKAILYELADGRRALRFEGGFNVLNDPDLVIWLSEAPAPKTSKEVVDSPHVELTALRSTKGSQNYIVPNDLSISKIGSVALYCVPVPSIYIAATLS